MNKIFILITILSVSIMNSFAQDADPENGDYREQLQFGLKAGVNVSNIYDTQGENTSADSKVGFVGGAFLSIPIGKFLGLQPELLYSQKGFVFNSSVSGVPYSFSRSTDYLVVPLLGQIKPSKFVTIVAGPQFAYLIHKSDTYDYGALTVQQQTDVQNNNIRKNTLGIVGGVDFNINFFLISLRVGGDIQNNNGDGTATSPRYKNIWFQTTVGLKF